MSIITFTSSLFPTSFHARHREVILRMVLKPSNDVNSCLGWWWYASKSNLMHGTVMQPFLQPEPSSTFQARDYWLLVSYLNPGTEDTKLRVLLDVSIKCPCYAAAQCLLFCLVNAITYRITWCIQILIRSWSRFRTMVPRKFTLFCRRFKGLYSFQVKDDVTNQWSLPSSTAGLSVINSLRRWRQHGSPKQRQHSPKKPIT
jgi:hypothetical protein